MDTEKLANPSRTIETIRKHGFVFRKRYGQNFLIDPSVPRRIVEAAEIGPEDCVVEVGPGIGTLTQYLAEAAGKVIAVEIDRKLIPILGETLSGCDNVTILNQDILKTDLRGISRDHHGGRPLKVVANLPYYITTPILMKLLEGDAPLSSVTVMVQKEVAQRMRAEPGSKDYGALSLAVQYYADARIVANVPPNCFLPRPEVASAVIRLDCRKKLSLSGEEEKRLFALIRAAFGQRRKTLVNSLKNGGLPYEKEDMAAALKALGLPENIRGEALSLEQFAMLERELRGSRKDSDE